MQPCVKVKWNDYDCFMNEFDHISSYFGADGKEVQVGKILHVAGASPLTLACSEAITNVPAVREKQVQASVMVQDARLFLELNKLEEAEAKLNQAKEL